MLSLNDIIDFCRAQALCHKLFPSEEADYRWFCREYSKTFFTPLHIVLEMDAQHVILCVLEEGLDHKRLKRQEDVDSIIEELRRLEDPNYDSTKEKEIDDWATGIEEWDEDRIAAGAPIPKKGQAVEIPKSTEKDLPKEGGVNLEYLSKEEEDSGGFED